jgi:hypothetical protein
MSQKDFLGLSDVMEGGGAISRRDGRPPACGMAHAAGLWAVRTLIHQNVGTLVSFYF